MKKLIFAAIIFVFAAGVLMQNSTESYAKKDVKNPKSVENINKLMTQGVGQSGKVPEGLLKAKGIQKKLQKNYGYTEPVIVDDVSDVDNEDSDIEDDITEDDVIENNIVEPAMPTSPGLPI
jgi:hypothetical protein